MARGTRPKNAPYPPNAGKGSEKMRAVRYTPDERREQLEFVDQAIVRGLRPAEIRRGAKERFNINPGRVDMLVRLVHERLEREYLERSAHRREVAVARSERKLVHLEVALGEARQAKDWKREISVLREHRHERDHLAMLHGLQQVTVNNNTVNVSIGQALFDVMGGMTGERAAEVVARARERERLASAYEREVLGVVDVSKLPPHANGTAQ